MSKQSDLVSVSQGSGGDPLYIDTTNDRIGVGTTTPVHPLHVNTSSGNSTIHITNSTTGGTIADGFSLVSEVTTNNAYIIQRENADLVFRTNNIERMRVDSNGRVGVGTTTPNGRITAAAASGGFNPNNNINNASVTTFGSYGGGVVIIDSGNPNSGTGYGVWVDNAGNDFNIARGTTSSAITGGVYIANNAGSWSARSDERDKLNLEPITDAANKVQSLRAVIGEYVWAEGDRHPFLIAQDVQAVLPEAVSVANKSAPEEDQRLGVSYTDVIPLLTAALQEALQKIDALEARVAELEAV